MFHLYVEKNSGLVYNIHINDVKIICLLKIVQMNRSDMYEIKKNSCYLRYRIGIKR